jgi:hypothetical protein
VILTVEIGDIWCFSSIDFHGKLPAVIFAIGCSFCYTFYFDEQ